MLRRGENIKRQPRIKLSTIHGSKGGEADNVMLLTDLTRKADEEYWRQRDQERRVFYVGMTRARNTLNIVRSQSDREFFGGVLMPFDIHTALKQLDVTLKQAKKTRAQLPKLNREKVDQELKILLLDLQLLQQDLIYMRDHAKKEIQKD